MSDKRGFFRHYKGHCYFAYGVACLKHENNRIVMIYTSVKTEEKEWYDFLARDQNEFDQWVCPSDPTHAPIEEPAFEDEEEWRAKGYEPRFQRITNPELSILPKSALPDGSTP